MQNPRMTRGAWTLGGAQDQRGCDMANKATWQRRGAHAVCRCAQVARTRGRGQVSPRERSSGDTWQRGWQVKGPRVSGPWLEYCGGNTIALNRPRFYA